ncbi:MAG: hypothetical protein QM564_00365 [Bergeyella sp.]
MIIYSRNRRLGTNESIRNLVKETVYGHDGIITNGIINNDTTNEALAKI